MPSSDFILTSDKPIDQVIYLKQTSYSIGAGTDITIAHGFPFKPLPMLQWSFLPDFSVSYEANTGPFPSGNPGYAFQLQISIEANATNIILRGNGVLAPSTIYVRIFCFPPHDAVAAIASTQALGDSFIIITDKNYMKLEVANKVSVSASSTATVPHTLGVIPHVLTWAESSFGTIYPTDVSYPGVNVNIEPTATSLIVRNDDFLGTWTVHYRIYDNA